MKKRIVSLCISTLVCIISFAQSWQNVEMWTKISPEIRMNIENSPWEFRLRPDDHIFMPEKYVTNGSVARIDFMFGAKLWKFKLFSYTKYDQTGRFWTGARLDFDFAIFNQKLLFNFQERYFFGLNDQSDDHYYLIQYIRYKTSKMSAVGLLSFGTWDIGQDFESGYWFIGPSIEVAEESGLSIRLAVTKDIYHAPVYMTEVRVGYKFMVRDRSKPITIDE